MLFTEDLLQFTWKFSLFELSGLVTTAGDPVELLSPGRHNQDSGPDFENARIRIGETCWAGNVEIHLKSSDWARHRHHHDLSYDNVILHVVYEHDKKIFRADGTEIPVLVLEGRIAEQVISGYRQLMENMHWIPCEKHLSRLEPLYTESWLSRMLVERMELRSAMIGQLLDEFKGSWEDALYVTLARNFGFKTNAVPFELLARSLPWKLLTRHQDQPLQVEALIFGQAGFLSGKFGEDYPGAMAREYAFLRRKYRLKPIDVFLWKFSRLRPRNFPTLRLAQFAAFALQSRHFFSRLVQAGEEESEDLVRYFTQLRVNPYWETHYHFKNPVAMLSPQIGKGSIHNILINTVAPFLFSYGKQAGGGSYQAKAILLLESIPPETNHVIHRFSQEGIVCQGAGSSQALLHLKKMYCERKKCLNCGIGAKLIKTGLNDTADLNLF